MQIDSLNSTHSTPSSAQNKTFGDEFLSHFKEFLAFADTDKARYDESQRDLYGLIANYRFYADERQLFDDEQMQGAVSMIKAADLLIGARATYSKDKDIDTLQGDTYRFNTQRHEAFVNGDTSEKIMQIEELIDLLWTPFALGNNSPQDIQDKKDATSILKALADFYKESMSPDELKVLDDKIAQQQFQKEKEAYSKFFAQIKEQSEQNAQNFANALKEDKDKTKEDLRIPQIRFLNSFYRLY